MKTVIILMVATVMVVARPQYHYQQQHQQQQHQELPEPYEYQYRVENQNTNTYFGKSENADQSGRVLGTYYVLLADGRLMTIEYSVEGESGFVPKITYQANANLQHG